MVRNEMYPELGDNLEGRCHTCGSDCDDDAVCPRDCDEYGPNFKVDLTPMSPQERTEWWLRARELA